MAQRNEQKNKIDEKIKKDIIQSHFNPEKKIDVQLDIDDDNSVPSVLSMNYLHIFGIKNSDQKKK